MAIGFNVISYSMDTAVFAAAMRQGVTEIRQLAG
jgi:hypothetical protein